MIPRIDFAAPTLRCGRNPTRRVVLAAFLPCACAFLLSYAAGCSKEPEQREGPAGGPPPAETGSDGSAADAGDKAFASAYEGKCRELDGDFEAAIRSYREAYSKSPDSQTLCKALAEAHFRAGEAGRALEILRSHAARLPGSSHECRLAAALILDRQGLGPEAEREISLLLSCPGGTPGVYRAVADRYLDQGLGVKAAQVMLVLGDAAGDRSGWAAEAASVLLSHGFAVQARQTAESALAAAPGDARLRLVRARCMASMGERTSSAREYVEIAKAGSSGPEIAVEAARAASAAGMNADAEGILSDAARKWPSDPDVRREQAGILARQGRFREAADALLPALAEAGGDADTLLLHAAMLEEAGDSAAAEAQALKALEADSKSLRARHFLAYLWASSGREPARALSYAEEAAAADPRVAVRLATAGLARARNGDFKGAAEMFSRALSMEEDPYVLWLHSIHLGLAGEAEESGKYLEMAAARNPRFRRGTGGTGDGR